MTPTKLTDDKKNSLYFLIGCFVLVYICIHVQSVRLQIIHSEELRKSAVKMSNFSLPHVRGDIFDRNGNRLAASMPVNSVIVDRRAMKDATKGAFQLHRALYMSYPAVVDKFRTGIKKSAFLKRHLYPVESEAVESLGLEGVILHKEYRRVYPNNHLASQFLGFVSKDGHGLEGLENSLDEILATSANSVKVRRDGKGRLMMDKPEQVLDQPKGNSVVLTLHLGIQRIAEEVIQRAVDRTGAAGGMVIAVVPTTGEILASVSYPSFDPNDFLAYPAENRTNKVLTHPFEPGSTFKVFTVAGALQDEVVKPDTTFFCERGVWQIDQVHAVRDTAMWGDLSVKDIVKVSSNICAGKIAERLTARRLYHYLTKFGFGQKTGLMYPSVDSAGVLRQPSKWEPIDTINIAFGQGVSVSALQLVMAVSALANEGNLMRPYLVSKVFDADKKIVSRTEPLMVREAVSTGVAANVLLMMREAVEHGTGKKAEIPGYPVAGKTGTAQKVSSGDTKYSEGKYVSSFVGVAPFNDPKICLLVVLDEPKRGYYGGEVVAPLFKEIVEKALPLLGVEKVDDAAPPEWATIKRSPGGVPGVLMAAAEKPYQLRYKLPDEDAGDGPLPSYFGRPSEELIFDAPELSTASAEDYFPEDVEFVRMPSLQGLTVREVYELMTKYDLPVQYIGVGRATDQEPKAGTPVARGQMARVRFRSINY
ncbi:MAG: transpeptidase family protein [Deltaproteobacteria bacterium]|nr:transpeptidase family protein [Deltaproteobacteria bacterium]